MGALLVALRDADWLTADRARAWCRVLAVTTIATTAIWLGLSRGGVDRFGQPLGTDFVSFWTASQLALDGRAAAAYDPATHAAAQIAMFPSGGFGYFAFFYPPTFLLLCLPLATIAYFPALVGWLAGGLLALLACLRRVLPQRWAALPVVACPAVLVNVEHGQNGFLSAICLSGYGLLLGRRPFLAGACLGMLVCKPQLLLGAPLVLLAARRWVALAGAASSAAGLCGLSWLLLGPGCWVGFVRLLPLARATLEQGLVDPGKLQSAFAAVRVLHGGVGVAYVVQALVAGGTGLVLGWAAARRPGGLAEAALLVAGTLLATPFLLDYDLVDLLVPMAWAMAVAQRSQWWRWEKIGLLAAYVLPLISRLLATEIGVPIGPLVLAGLFAVIVRRAVAMPAAGGG